MLSLHILLANKPWHLQDHCLMPVHGGFHGIQALSVWQQNRPLAQYHGIILGIGSANERRRYIVTSSFIGWAHTLNDPCIIIAKKSSWHAPFFQGQTSCLCIYSLAHYNSLRAKFCRWSINIYLHFMSLLHIDMTHVLIILPQLRPGPTYST